MGNACAHLADARVTVGDARVDHGPDTRLHNATHINPRWRPLKIHGGDRKGRMISDGDSVHFPGMAEGVFGLPRADETYDRGRGRHGKPADTKGLDDCAVSDVGIGVPRAGTPESIVPAASPPVP